MDFLKLQKETEAAVREASKLMMGAFTTEEKGSPANIVTSADLAVQHFMEQRLPQILPGSAVFGEEGSGDETDASYLWIVDPIDGTTNFARGIPEYAISVALLHEEELLLGVVYNPRQDKLYSAVRGLGASCNGKPIHVSDKPFEAGLFCTAMSLYRKEFAGRCMDVIREVYAQCSDVRRFGSCALELCYLAEGTCDLYFEYRVFPWDCAGALLILQEAGGASCTAKGLPVPMDRAAPVLAANNRENLERILKIVDKHIPDFGYEEILRCV
jgi:myo-inositol-1(or 4)-monophosphatase